MIYGIGTDLCDVGRIEKSIARPAFLQHVYTPAEQALIAAHTGKKQAETAAANFAAKEAFLNGWSDKWFAASSKARQSICVVCGTFQGPSPARWGHRALQIILMFVSIYKMSCRERS